MPSQSLTIISEGTVFPAQISAMDDLKLSVSDLPMLSCHYIQKGCLFTHPPFPFSELVSNLKESLSQTLIHFPPLAGRLTTDEKGYIYITCNDAGVDLIHANASHLYIRDILRPVHVPETVQDFFAFDQTVSYEGHFRPILAVQVTELADGVFIGCSVNHAVVDGTSLWNFFNSFAELSRGMKRISRSPDFSRDSVLVSPAVLKVPAGGPKVTFSRDDSLKERIFSFSRESILRLKAQANNQRWELNGGINVVELMGKQRNDTLKFQDEMLTPLTWLKNVVSKGTRNTAEISSFQSLCALLWRGITRARNLPPSKTTTFRMAVNCRHRLDPKLEPLYFGNAIQSIPTCASAGDVLSKDLHWCAGHLNKNVLAHDNDMVRKYIEDWERDPRCFPLGNFDGAMITMGSSPRFQCTIMISGGGGRSRSAAGRRINLMGRFLRFPAGKVGEVWI